MPGIPAITGLNPVLNPPPRGIAGLTSRPRPPASGSQSDSPYGLRSQAALTLALARQLGLRQVLFVGHSDGALLALLATSLAAEAYREMCLSNPPHEAFAGGGAQGGRVHRSDSEGQWKHLGQQLQPPVMETGGSRDSLSGGPLPPPSLKRSQSEPANQGLTSANAGHMVGLNGGGPHVPELPPLLVTASRNRAPLLPAPCASAPHSEAGSSTESSSPDSRSKSEIPEFPR